MNVGQWSVETSFGEQIAGAITADPTGAVLVFDFDGTLSRIEPRPEDATFYPPAAEALGRLGNLGARLAILTGREARTVVRIGALAGRPGLERLQVFGLYGVERWDAQTGEFQLPEIPASVPAALADLEAFLQGARCSGRDTSGIFLEDKERAIGVHYRRSPDPAVESWLLEPLAKIAANHALHVLPGKKIVELAAATTSKGDAMVALIAQTDPRVLIMAGDDVGDIPAMEVCREARAAGVLSANIVSASPEAPEVAGYADILCGGPEGVASWLTHVLGAD